MCHIEGLVETRPSAGQIPAHPEEGRGGKGKGGEDRGGFGGEEGGGGGGGGGEGGRFDARQELD